jgi:hypothetical protein
MYDVHRLLPLRLVPPPAEPDRSAKVVALKSRSEALKQDRVPQLDPERSPQPPRWDAAA